MYKQAYFYGANLILLVLCISLPIVLIVTEKSLVCFGQSYSYSVNIFLSSKSSEDAAVGACLQVHLDIGQGWRSPHIIDTTTLLYSLLQWIALN